MISKACIQLGGTNRSRAKRLLPCSPFANGKPHCWDFLSRAGCGRGENCALPHSTIRVAGLRWLIQAQLARSVGHVSRPSIAPGSIDGNIQSHREAHVFEPEKHPNGAQWQVREEKDLAG